MELDSESGSATLSGRMDEALDAEPNRKRAMIFLILAGGWWVPDSPYGACLCPAGLSVRQRLGLCSLSPP
jgi:hypothetical protein